jgi:hypothetical protein
MSNSILSAIMRTAKDITDAERAMTVISDLTVVDVDNLSLDTINDEAFQDVALKCLSQAMETNESVLTNNIITDPSQAPVTNTNFTDLRIIVAIPVQGEGAVYLDQHIRNGMFQRDTIDKLNRMVAHVVDLDDRSLGESELRQIYDDLE